VGQAQGRRGQEEEVRGVEQKFLAYMTEKTSLAEKLTVPAPTRRVSMTSCSTTTSRTGPSRPRHASARSMRIFVNQLYTADIPKDLKSRTSGGNRPREIFCDALVDKAEPIESKAVVGYDLCLKAATKESWSPTSGRPCARVELNQMKPAEYPLAGRDEAGTWLCLDSYPRPAVSSRTCPINLRLLLRTRSQR